MAYIQQTTPKPNQVYDFSMRNFVGGLNNRSEQLEVNEAHDLLNMRFVDETVMQKRNGSEEYDTLTLTSPVTFIDEYKPHNDVDKFIRATDSEVYVDGVKLADVTGKINGTNHLGRYFYVDGNKLMVYGKFAQTTSTYIEVIGTAVDDYVLMEVVSPPDEYTPLDNTHEEGVLKVDYTNNKVWYEPCELEVSDTYLEDNKIPVNCKYVLSHNGRLVLAGNEDDDDKVYIGRIENPFYFPKQLVYSLPPTSDKITGVSIYDNTIVIGRRDDIYVLPGATKRPDLGLEVFHLKRLNTHTGFASNDAVVQAHNYLFFLGSDGNAYSLGSTKYDERTLATIILSKKIDVTREPINLTLDDLKDSTSIFFKDEWLISIKDKVLVYSYRHRAWTLYNNLNARYFYNLDYTLIWGNDSGQIAKFSTGYLDMNKPFQGYWISKWFNMDRASNYKFFREFYIIAHTFSDVISDVDILFEIDYGDKNMEHRVSSKVTVWGKAKWGDLLVNRDIMVSLPINVSMRGRMIRFNFSNSYFVHGEVATYADLEYYPTKQNGTLVYVQDEDSYYLWDVDDGYNAHWEKKELTDLNQTMKVYQVNGDYELRGKR